jgi:D-glycero-alpha-D-manno-heptose-7-phosphate kinase
VEPLICQRRTTEQIQSNLLTFYTGLTRSASVILRDQQAAMGSQRKKQNVMRRMTLLAEQLRRALHANQADALGEIIHEGWILKKSLTSAISSSVIDDWYARARKAGATGGKLLGAGAGGFLIFYAPRERHEAVAQALGELCQVDFRFEPHGSRIIFVHQ